MSFEMSGEATETIGAPPDQVYDVISDITRMGEWSPECVGGTWTGGSQGPVEGATFDGHNARGGNEWTTPNTIIGAERPRLFAWVVGEPAGYACRWTYRLEPDGDVTRVTQSFELGPVEVGFRSMVSAAPEDRREAMVAGRKAQLEADMADTLSKIKAAVEAG